MEQTPITRRRRPALACTQCRRRKMRCDQNRPCNNCAKSRSSDCTYPTTHVPAGRIARSEAPTGGRMGPLLAPRPTNGSLHEGSQRIDSPHEDINTRSTPGHGCPPRHNFSPRVDSVNVPDMMGLDSRVSNLESSILTPSRPDHDSHHQTHDRSVEEPQAVPREKTMPSGPRFANQSNWLNHTSLYSQVLLRLSQAEANNSELRTSMAQCKVLGQRISERLSAPSDTALTPIGARFPERSIADRLLDAYFCHFEGVFRILHVPSFRAEYGKYREPLGAPKVFLLQAQTCMALGTLASDDPLEYGDLPSRWISEAHNWITSGSQDLKRKLTIKELQLGCLVLLARANGLASERTSWVDAGILVRKAMALDLHRDPTHLGLTGLLEAETRRRLWATIMELNLLLSLQAAQPPLVSAFDYDTRAPASVADEDLVANQSDNHDQSVRNKFDGQTMIQSAMYVSFGLRLLVASKINAVGTDLPYTEVLKLHSNLTQAAAHLRDHLSSQSMDDPQRVMAEVIFCRCILALHLPILGKHIKDAAFHFSRRVCASLAIDIMNSCGIPKLNTNLANAGRTRRATGFGIECLFINSSGLFRGLALQPIFAILLELLALREEQHGNTGALPAWDEAQILQYAELGQIWAKERICRGSADVHSYILVAACRTYADALASRTATKEEIGRAVIETALESRKICHGRMAEAAERLDNIVARRASSGAVATQTEDVTGRMETYSDWQNDFGMFGVEYFGAFDWTDLADPSMPDFGTTQPNFMVP